MTVPEQLNEIIDKLDALIEHSIAMKPEPGRPQVHLSQLVTMFNFIKAGYLLEAIKDARTITGCGLKEAKDLVEILYRREE